VCTNHCIATVAALTIANPLLLRYPAASSKHSFFYCCVPFEVSMASAATAWRKHALLYFGAILIFDKCSVDMYTLGSTNCCVTFVLKNEATSSFLTPLIFSVSTPCDKANFVASRYVVLILLITVQCKVKLSLCLIKHQTMKMYGGYRPTLFDLGIRSR
jgi:hypothetical protein